MVYLLFKEPGVQNSGNKWFGGRNKLKVIYQWLRQIEQHACEIYQEASAKLSDDENFSIFLSQLAEDESWHYHIMGSALIQINEAKNPPISEIRLDDSTASLLEKPLVILKSSIEKNIVSRQDVVNCIVDAEFFEWNWIFLYAVNILKNESKEFQYAAASIQAHLNKIRQFLNSLPSDIVISKKILELKPVWEQRILVVEDDEPLRELVSLILSTIGHIDTAINGFDALEKVRNNFYNVIISDIDMPIMNGLEFFENAIKIDPLLSKRFIFCTGDISIEKEKFFSKHGTSNIQKPFDILKFKEIINKRISESL